MPTFTVPLHEFNKCHNPDGEGGGQFCSTGAQTTAAGDEDGTGRTPLPAGTTIRVLRIGHPKGTNLTNKNAGNAEAVADHYMRWLNDEIEGIGNTLHVFEVTLTEPTAGYQRMVGGKAEDKLADDPQEVVAGSVGRHVRPDHTVTYSFPEGGAYTVRHIGTISTNDLKVFQQYGSLTDRANALRRAIERM